MARANEPGGLLRGCPTCGTPVSEAQLGLRDFSWINEYLPGKVGFMDVDGLLDQEKTGRALILEFKSRGAGISLGSRISFKGFRRRGFDVWIVWDEGGGNVAVAEFTWKVLEKSFITKDQLGKRVAEWWEAGTATN